MMMSKDEHALITKLLDKLGTQTAVAEKLRITRWRVGQVALGRVTIGTAYPKAKSKAKSTAKPTAKPKLEAARRALKRGTKVAKRRSRR